MTNATRARRLHARDPSLTPTEIAQRIDSTRQAVEQALAASPKLGRPGVESAVVRLSVAALRLAKRAARLERVTARAWIERAIGATAGATDSVHTAGRGDTQ